MAIYLEPEDEYPPCRGCGNEGDGRTFCQACDDAAEDEGAEYAQYLEDVAESDDPESYR